MGFVLGAVLQHIGVTVRDRRARVSLRSSIVELTHEQFTSVCPNTVRFLMQAGVEHALASCLKVETHAPETVVFDHYRGYPRRLADREDAAQRSDQTSPFLYHISSSILKLTIFI